MLEFMEFVNEHFPVSTPYGPVGAMLSSRMHGIDPISQIHNFCFCRHVAIATLVPQSFTWDIPEDYAYHLNSMRISYPPDVRGESPEVLYQVRMPSQNRRYTDTVIPIRILASPVESQTREIALLLDQTILPGGLVEVVIQATDAARPGECTILIEGIRIPRQVLEYH